MLQLLLAVFIGGGTGSVARWFLSMRFNPLHQAIPMGTLAANLIGAFIIGMGLAWFNRMTHIDPMWKVLITTGFCGGVTTLSTLFSGKSWPGRPYRLGADEYGDQYARLLCDDGDRILAIFFRKRALTAEPLMLA